MQLKFYLLLLKEKWVERLDCIIFSGGVQFFLIVKKNVVPLSGSDSIHILPSCR